MTNRQTVNIVDHEVGALDIASERKLILESVTRKAQAQTSHVLITVCAMEMQF